MRILLAAYGSRGDVQPLVALGRGLKAAGHQVMLMAGSNFASWIETTGLTFEPFSLDIQAMVNSDLGRTWLNDSSRAPMRELENMRRMVDAYHGPVVDDLIRMRDAADVYVSGLLTLGPLNALTRVNGKRHVVAWLSPMVRSRIGAAGVQAPLPHANSIINDAFGTVIHSLLWNVFRSVTETTHARLGLAKPTRGHFARLINQTPSINGFSRHVVPAEDWDARHDITGYWVEPASAYEPPPALADFLAAGAPPVYIGFGSMSSSDPAATTQIMLDALAQSGQRGIIHSGWAGLKAAAPASDVLFLDYAPHEWLFPRMAAVVHHGGAGTSAAGMRAGVSSLVVAHIGDQGYWGRRIHELGVGAAPVRRHALTAGVLAEGIRHMVADGAMRARAAALGETLRAEDGVARAVERINALIAD